MENSKNSSLSKLIPVMLCFFAMGFVDLVGIASNYVKADLGLSDSQANIFPSLVFFWFLIFSVPTGMLMSRIGTSTFTWYRSQANHSVLYILGLRRRGPQLLEGSERVCNVSRSIRP